MLSLSISFTKPLSFSSAIRGLHGKEWTLADKQELIKLLVTLKCLLPVMRASREYPHLSKAGGQREVGRVKQPEEKESEMDDRGR